MATLQADVAAYQKKSLVLKWKDKKYAFILSTLHDGSIIQMKSWHAIDVNKPKAVANYNSRC